MKRDGLQLNGNSFNRTSVGTVEKTRNDVNNLCLISKTMHFCCSPIASPSFSIQKNSCLTSDN